MHPDFDGPHTFFSYHRLSQKSASAKVAMPCPCLASTTMEIPKENPNPKKVGSSGPEDAALASGGGFVEKNHKHPETASHIGLDGRRSPVIVGRIQAGSIRFR